MVVLSEPTSLVSTRGAKRRFDRSSMSKTANTHVVKKMKMDTKKQTTPIATLLPRLATRSSSPAMHWSVDVGEKTSIRLGRVTAPTARHGS